MQINFVKNFTFGIGNTNKNLYHSLLCRMGDGFNAAYLLWPKDFQNFFEETSETSSKILLKFF